MPFKKHVRQKKIVLVEDEPVIAEIVPQFLKPIGYEVVVASQGDAALKLIKRQLPDLIIIDSDIAGTDGFALCQALKSDFLTSYIPLIILIDKRQIRKRLLEIQEGIDDYIIKPPDPIDLQVRIEMALRRTDHQVHASSLTRLPGNKAIENAARARITEEKPFSFMYLDIDHFKSFNDIYGYLRGDGVIMQTTRILTSCVARYGNKNDFIGHIGGDDFVVMTTPDKEKILAQEIIREFNRLIPLHYNVQDRLLGHLLVKDRQGHDMQAPLMTLSAAIVNNRTRKINNILELVEIASEIKRHLKTVAGSKFLINRRASSKGQYGQNQAFKPQEAGTFIVKEESEMLPIGQMLLKAGLIDENQLMEALFEHWSSRELLGQTLIKMGLIDEKELEPFLTKAASK